MNEICYVGYSAVHPDTFVYDIPDGFDCYLLVLTHTRACFHCNDTIVEAPPGTAILYTPDSPIHYSASGQEYKNDWIRFHSDESCVEKFPLKNTPFPVSDFAYCHQLIKLITWEDALSGSSQELIFSNLLQVLFLKLREDAAHREDSFHVQELLELRKKIHNMPQLDWSIREMADTLHLSTGYLQFLYKKSFGISCMDDVIRSRLRRACEELVSTSKPIQEIAYMCGYSSIEHFHRQFHKHHGCTPKQFRIRSRSEYRTQSHI